MTRRRRWLAPLAGVMLGVAAIGAPASAESDWVPFRTEDGPTRRPRAVPPADSLPPPLPPMDGVMPPPAYETLPAAAGRQAGQGGFGTVYPGTDSTLPAGRPSPGPYGGGTIASSSKVERFELEPALAADGNALPRDAWRGMDIKAVEENLASLTLPPRSPTLHGALIRLLAAAVDPPQGGRAPAHFDAVRLEVLYRSGLVAEMGARLSTVSPDDPVFQAFAIRHNLALGNRAPACRTARALIGRRGELPKALVSELQLLAGFCAAVDGNAAGAGLAAELAREDGVDAPVALAALDALAGNGKAGLVPPKRVAVLDYRLLELLGAIDPAQILDKAEPALIAALALDGTVEQQTRVMAAEAAARLSAITPEQLFAVYRAMPAGADDAALRRAELVRVISAEGAASRRLQLCKSVLDDARRTGLLLPMARVLAPFIGGTQPTPDVQAQSETAVEIFLAAGDLRKARAFAQAPAARHWLALIDIADSDQSEALREQNLQGLEDLVRRGRFPADLLHRLATVLDATDVNVPIPLWEAASRTPQPASGYLPETGVLAQLQDAAKKKEVGRTVLLALRALGPTGADGAHMIALGDSLRALRRAGLDADARRLGVEALIAQWPRGGAS